MKLAKLGFMTLFLCVAGGAQQPTPASETLMDALLSLPSQAASKSVDMLAFTNVLEAQVTDPKTNVAATLPLLREYLASPDEELRRYTVLTVSQLARRPNSAVELTPLLSDLNAHLYEQDIHIRITTLLAIQTLKPDVPDASIAALVEALGKANTTDYFGAGLAQALALVRPDDNTVQEAILGYLHKPELTENQKASFLELVANPHLGEETTREFVSTANTAPPGRLRNAAITACAKIGPRAVNPIREKLALIAADPTETPESRSAAQGALRVLLQQRVPQQP
jgi:hypothetical protein